MGKLFILLGIHVITRRMVQRRRWEGGGRYDNSPTSKIYTTWTRILSDGNIFYIPGGGRITAGSNAPGAFLVTPPSGRGLVIPGFFYPAVRTGSSNTRFFFGGHLPQTFARSKQHLPVIFVRLEFIRQNFHDSWCRKLLVMQWHKNLFDESKNEGASEL